MLLGIIYMYSVPAILFEKWLKIMQVATFVGDTIVHALLARVFLHPLAPTTWLYCCMLPTHGWLRVVTVLVQPCRTIRVTCFESVIPTWVVDDRLQWRVLVDQSLRVEFWHVKVLRADIVVHLTLQLYFRFWRLCGISLLSFVLYCNFL